MTAKNLAQRLARIEAQRRPAARVVVCWCEDDEKHHPDCPALTLADGDNLVIVWEDDTNHD